jgi:hypothetical protein
MSQAKLAKKRFNKKLKRKGKTYTPKQYYRVEEGQLVDDRLPRGERPPLVVDTETIQL